MDVIIPLWFYMKNLFKGNKVTSSVASIVMKLPSYKWLHYVTEWRGQSMAEYEDKNKHAHVEQFDLILY